MNIYTSLYIMYRPICMYIHAYISLYSHMAVPCVCLCTRRVSVHIYLCDVCARLFKCICIDGCDIPFSNDPRK